MAFGTQYAMRMRHSFCGLSIYTIFSFSKLSHKRYIFEKKKALLILKLCLIFLATFAETLLILRINERDMIKNVNWSSCKVDLPIFIVIL